MQILAVSFLFFLFVPPPPQKIPQNIDFSEVVAVNNYIAVWSVIVSVCLRQEIERTLIDKQLEKQNGHRGCIS